ncbi:hypothetical protein SAY86_020889 [Trapa natans]|uniref:F-box domain-containing protein n=1 Tax=Trapa natans TaxID=22666 RepID=A0AAN7REE0_TRANT|nr:hypothetical protein SAY86_020889 [Trapa natans]
MGAIFSYSSFASSAAPPSAGLGALPESCVASVLTYLEPKDICRLAELNRAFRDASFADFVWESKLPSNYGALFRRLFDLSADGFSKREVYRRLCATSGFDGGTKSVWLDMETSRICLQVSAKSLAITGVDDRRYWNCIPTEESRFSSVVYLQQTWWFEVHGEVDFPFPPGTYSVFFRLQLGRASKNWLGCRVCNTDHVHGWDIKPVRFQLWTSEGQHSATQCFLESPGKWVNYHVDDFTVRGQDSGTTRVRFSTMQIDCTHTKGGLCLDSVLICPCEYKERYIQPCAR